MCGRVPCFEVLEVASSDEEDEDASKLLRCTGAETMTEDNKRTWTEELEIAGKDLLSVIESVIKDGTAKRVVIRNKEGRSLLEIPLAAGVAVGGAAVLMAPVLV